MVCGHGRDATCLKLIHLRMKNDKGIIAYGTELDREKLAVLATLSGQSGSEWIVNQIREVYGNAFGDVAPKCIIPQHS